MKFTLKERIEDEIILPNDETKEINTVITMFSKKGMEIKCEYCNFQIKVVKITDTSDSLKELLYCTNCNKELGNMIKLMNNFTFNVKKFVFKYFLGIRRCSKCKDTTKLFLKKK